MRPSSRLAPGGIDQFRCRCIHSSTHSHVYWGAQPFLQHAIGTVQYIVHQPPTRGAFESVSFLSAWIDRYSTRGLRRGYLSEILIQITRSKYGNAPCQINDDLFAYNYRYEKPSSGCIVLELSMSSLKPWPEQDIERHKQIDQQVRLSKLSCCGVEL